MCIRDSFCGTLSCKLNFANIEYCRIKVWGYLHCFFRSFFGLIHPPDKPDVAPSHVISFWPHSLPKGGNLLPPMTKPFGSVLHQKEQKKKPPSPSPDFVKKQFLFYRIRCGRKSKFRF
eukprot:TRINITY_DN3561_c0_g1_i5.p1 TRINITY_DN3561_c0_g1~~TRINITY_DN3561_c0_g1_i5.p1  ORF type:complete len:118 (+),score=6.72 TRINITY_DN3561_c0_g1_i5:22-375(+)